MGPVQLVRRRRGAVVVFVVDVLAQLVEAVDLVEDFDLCEVGVGSVTPVVRGFDCFGKRLVGVENGRGGDGDEFEAFGGDEVPGGVDFG
jgi:hypothetical protein